MKHKKILRIFGIALILSLLFIALPASPASAAITLTLLPNTGMVGTQVTVYGTGFSATSAVAVYFSNQSATLQQTIDTNVTVYKTLFMINTVDTTGTFTQTFLVPSVMNSSGNVAVTPGTYYLYTCILTSFTPNAIQSIVAFTVTGNPAITLSPTTGAAGSSVTINGSGFPASTPLVFNFGGTTVTPSGHAATLSTGLFLSTIVVPSGATATAYIITVSASTSSAVATFTVTGNPTITLSTATGTAGSTVTITGSNFPANNTLAIKFDSTILTSVFATTAGLIPSSTTITIPSDATATTTHTITVSASSTIFATANFTVTAVSAILNTPSPASGPAGTDVLITGSNFPAGATITVKLDGTTIPIKTNAETTVRSTGGIITTVTIPATTAVGPHPVTVTAGSSTTTSTFTVTETTTPTPTPSSPLNIKAGGDTVGSSIAVAHAGFFPNSKVTVTYDGLKVAEDNTDASGFFVITFQAPSSIHGIHAITASDGTNIASANFTVESTPPIVPQPLSPRMEEAVSSPVTFDWADVTDASLPVTYNLQIATSSNFTADSIIINKTALTKSEYILSEADELKLASEASFYWREKSVDAALNESAWTGAGEFTVAQPFKFTGWPLYLTIGVGAVVIFLFGLWIGRRSAFYY